MKREKTAGFTLIELVIVLSMIGIVLGIGVSTLASTLRSSAKTTIYNKVKQNGDLALEVMTRSIQSAIDACTRDGSDPNSLPDEILIYTGKVSCGLPPTDAKVTHFKCTEQAGPSDGKIEKIEEEAGRSNPPVPLISDVKIKSNSCNFVASNTTPKRVLIEFTLQQPSSLGSASDVAAEIPFRSEVTVRNF